LITIEVDTRRIAAALDALASRQLPYAASRALNDTVKDAKDRVTRELPAIFDRPTPFTRTSIATLSANRTSLAATVLVKDTQAKYLKHEEIGGTRTPAENTRKASQALVLPGRELKLDAFGNIPSGAVARLKQEITRVGRRARRDAARAAFKGMAASSQRNTGIAYFKGAGPKGGPGGFFRRLAGHKLVRLTGFEGATRYRPRFGFQARVAATVRSTFPDHMARRLLEAVTTAR
jgi:hypothetical protein